MDKFINKPNNEVCDISLIYSDNPSKTMNEPIKNKQITLSKAITSSFIQNNAQTRDTNTLQNNLINGQKLISPPSPVVIVTGEGIFVLYYDTFILKIEIFTKQKKLCIIKMLHKTT